MIFNYNDSAKFAVACGNQYFCIVIISDAKFC